MNRVEEIAPPSPAQFEKDVRPSYRPVVMRGVAADWPIVQRGREEAGSALDLIETLDSGRPTEIMAAPAKEGGRFFYAPDMRGFNFRRDQATLSDLAGYLRQVAGQDGADAAYAGATSTMSHLPGFEETHPFPLAEAGGIATTRLWLGNATQVATHFDLSDNFAVVAVGSRTFTLFPPDAVGDLYVGPLDVTLAGQPVSMVDPLEPDLERFPRFEQARERALVAQLEPGDAIYIPALWWHHVAAAGDINVLVNYWHNDAQRGGGFLALIHAMQAIRDLPAAQREAWRAWFDHMVFGEDAPRSADHLPAHARGVNGPAGPERDERIRAFLLRVLSA